MGKKLLPSEEKSASWIDLKSKKLLSGRLLSQNGQYADNETNYFIFLAVFNAFQVALRLLDFGIFVHIIPVLSQKSVWPLNSLTTLFLATYFQCKSP